MSEIKSLDLESVLKVGHMLLSFQGMTDPEEVKANYSTSFPHLRDARIKEPYVEGDKLIYEIEKPPAKTKG